MVAYYVVPIVYLLGIDAYFWIEWLEGAKTVLESCHTRFCQIYVCLMCLYLYIIYTQNISVHNMFHALSFISSNFSTLMNFKQPFPTTCGLGIICGAGTSTCNRRSTCNGWRLDPPVRNLVEFHRFYWTPWIFTTFSIKQPENEAWKWIEQAKKKASSWSLMIIYGCLRLVTFQKRGSRSLLVSFYLHSLGTYLVPNLESLKKPPQKTWNISNLELKIHINFPFLTWNQHTSYIWPNGIIVHQPRFPWNSRGPISLPKRIKTWGPKTPLRSLKFNQISRW